jgi:hypothetical protein
MAEIIETSEQEQNDKSGRRRFVVLDVADALTARAMVNALAPVNWDHLQKTDVQVRELGAGQWEGEAQYGQKERGELGDIAWNFNISTTNAQITHALEHVATYPATAEDHAGAINVESDGNSLTVKGASVAVPKFTWDETHYYAAAVVATHAFITNLENLVATCNQAAWRIWGAQELLLLGVQSAGSKEMDDTLVVGVKYRFASSRTRTGQAFGDVTGVTLTGHNILWMEYEEDPDSGHLTSQVVAVHTERVYRLEDWAADLPLPDPWS